MFNPSLNAPDETWLQKNTFFDLTSLTTLDLPHNQLGSLDQTLLQRIKSLSRLDLPYWSLESPSSQVLTQLTNLRTLALTHVVKGMIQPCVSSHSHFLPFSSPSARFLKLALSDDFYVAYEVLGGSTAGRR